MVTMSTGFAEASDDAEAQNAKMPHTQMLHRSEQGRNRNDG